MIPPSVFELLAPLLAPLTLVDADDNGTRPPKPFWEVRVRSVNHLTRAKDEVDAQGIVRHTANAAYNVELTCHGQDAFQRAQQTEMAMHFDSFGWRACQLQMGIGPTNSVSQVPVFLNNSQHEEAGMIDFVLYERVEAFEDVGLIEHAVIGGRFEPNGNAPPVRIVTSAPDAVMPPPSSTEV